MMWFRPELRVLFVCTANVCRSPLAEAMLRHRLRAMGLGRRVQVRSAGTRVGQRGRRPDPRVVKVAGEAGVSLGRIRAAPLVPDMLANSDYVLVMDRGHLSDITVLMGDAPVPESVRLLGEYVSAETAEADIADPYFGHLEGFVEVFSQIDRALDGLVPDLQQRLRGSGLAL
ncbi:low molecular weight phosphotyrosine protein phosphatase [Kineobactrum sediminis]|uniref:protein-tyrosine-phosphatase n=1 Tax=Kineobactrum sediminis TaxID=1905677 RepID=A0A2N5XZH3_9GAMM|nr:low molecular weight protein-tyrosine-phosphatase [Kineobactrum sediminis]PLW81544.1 low molecular weight phosphotyrosine protein phosphatase [Kineobactrum sediminis]